MRKGTMALIATVLFGWMASANEETGEKVVDIPTRPHVTERLLVLAPKNSPKAAVILLAGGHGGLQISDDGSFSWGKGNFLVRSRRLFADQGLLVVVVDAPSDRLRPPYLSGFRGTAKHVMDLKAVIAWVRKKADVPVWLVGTSRGTESAAYTATYLTGRDGPDGVVLTSTILTDSKEFPVTSLQLDRVQIPVLIVHHVDDGCRHCSYAQISRLMDALVNTPRKQLIPVQGGQSQGDPCEAWSHHGFNGIEPEVVKKIAAWMLQK
jgi:acetyl esterase/lipase